MFSPASAARARTTTAKSNIQRLRHIYQPRLCHVLAMQPRFAPNTDEDSARLALEQLTAQLRSRRWTLASDGEAIERSFKFKTFAKTWDFMTAVSLQCKTRHHHPEWSNIYNTTFIRWTTHAPKGLSEKDLDMARICDQLARDFDELDPEPTSCESRDLVDKTAELAADCCVPKK